MTPEHDEYSTAELVRWLQRMDDGQKEILSKLDSMQKNFVSRAEWEQYQKDEERRISQVEKHQEGLEARKIPWTAVVSALAALLALAVSLHLIG